jgi:hypothetical protein
VSAKTWADSGRKGNPAHEDSDKYRMALGSTTAIVVGADDMPHILQLLTMTGISYLKGRKAG